MAHYAFLDENNIVTEIIVGKDEGEDGIDWEQWYGEFKGQVCKRTSYNTLNGIYYDQTTRQPSEDQSKAFRKNFAGLGYTYDFSRDAFIPPQPYSSWFLNEQKCSWEPPVPLPNEQDADILYKWDESLLAWVLK